MKCLIIKFNHSYLLITILFTILITNSEAQSGSEAAFKKGSKTIGFSAGVGVEYNYYNGYNSLPAFAITYDQGFFEGIGPGNIGIGGIIGIKNAHYNYSNSKYKATWNNYIIGVRGTYHLTLLKDKNNKFDPYAGILLGVRISNYRDTYYNTVGYNPYSYGSVYFEKGAFLGAKYNFSKIVGVFAEAGYDISLFRGGLNLNF